MKKISESFMNKKVCICITFAFAKGLLRKTSIYVIFLLTPFNTRMKYLASVAYLLI